MPDDTSNRRAYLYAVLVGHAEFDSDGKLVSFTPLYDYTLQPSSWGLKQGREFAADERRTFELKD